jgi:pyruvate kinase
LGEPGAEPLDDAFSTTRAASRLAMDRGVAAIAVFTMSGRTARLMSKARPPAPILAFTASQATHRQMGLLWGVEPRLCDYADSVEAMIQTVERDLLDSGRVARGQQVVIVASLPVGARGAPNFTYLHTLS